MRRPWAERFLKSQKIAWTSMSCTSILCTAKSLYLILETHDVLVVLRTIRRSRFRYRPGMKLLYQFPWFRAMS